MRNENEVNWNQVKSIYNALCDELTLAQYSKLMGGSMEYLEKAKRAKAVSKSKNVKYCADAMIYLITGQSEGLDQLQKHNLNK